MRARYRRRWVGAGIASVLFVLGTVPGALAGDGTPTANAQAAATPRPTLRPPPTLRPAPSAGTTLLPTPSAAPSAGAVLSLGADTPAFTDTFDEDPPLWGVSDGPSGLIAATNGVLVIKVLADSNSLWSWRQLDAASPVMRVEGSVSTLGDGAAGYMCGSAKPDFLLAVVSPTEWIVGQIVANAIKVLLRGPLPDGSGAANLGTATITIECAATGSGEDRIVMWVDGTQVADVQDAGIGPFDRAAVYADDIRAPMEASFDDVTVSVGDRYAETIQASAVDTLLTHVPTAFREHCQAVDVTNDTGQVAGVVCFPAGDADQAEYYQYDSATAASNAFDAFLSDSGSDTPGDACKVGASDVTYTIGGESAGRLACYPNQGSLGGTTFMWTDDQLAILTFGFGSAGDYGAMYEWWLGAGPDR